MGISRRQRPSRYELTHGMSGLFRKVSRRAKITGLCGWAGRIRTSKCRFLEVRDKAFESTREYLAGFERLRSRDFAAFLRANRAISDATEPRGPARFASRLVSIGGAVQCERAYWGS